MAIHGNGIKLSFKLNKNIDTQEIRQEKIFSEKEERQFDDIPEVELVLVRQGYKRIGGKPVKARFINNTCIISMTKRDFRSYAYNFKDGMFAETEDSCYVVKSFHYDKCPKYPILTLTPISDSKHLRECFNYVMGRVARGSPVQYTLPHIHTSFIHLSASLLLPEFRTFRPQKTKKTPFMCIE